MVPRWWIFGDFLGPAFSASHMQHISHILPKFALRPRHVWKYGIDIQSLTAEIRREEKKKKPHGKNIMSASAMQSGHNNLMNKWVIIELLH